MKRIILPLAAILASMCSCRKDDRGHQTGWSTSGTGLISAEGFTGKLIDTPISNLVSGDQIFAIINLSDKGKTIAGLTAYSTKDNQIFDWLSISNPNDFRVIWRTQITNKWKGVWTLETNAP